MNKIEKDRFDNFYQQLLKCLKLQGKAEKTIDAYSRVVGRMVAHSDRRANTNSHYNGPSRRYTIERRLNLKDRRDNC